MRGLLVIDMQKGIVALDESAWTHVLDNIASLLERARASHAPVVFVQHTSRASKLLVPGTQPWEIHDAIRPQPGEAVIQKQWSDSFAGTDLEAVLRASGLDTLVIAGAETEYCVDTTVRSAASLGFNVVLASDAHSTASDGPLTREQIVAHHNEALPQLALVDVSISVVPSRDISFGEGAN